MLALRFMKLVSTMALLAFASSSAPIEEECQTPGECENPSTEDVTTEIDEAIVDAEILEAEKEPEDPLCPSRDHIIRCATEFLDSNKNSKLERAELEAGIERLPWYSRGVLRILGSISSIMSKCDADGDDAIGIDDDMEQTKERCLATCFKRKAFKKVFFPECDI